MEKFKTLERRISANEDQTRFRVQYKKNGKARANILRSLEEARALRDATDSPEMKKQTQRLAQELQSKAAPAHVPAIEKEVFQINPDDLSTEKKKLELVDRYLKIVEKILNI